MSRPAIRLCARRRAFTLAETVASLVVVSLVLVALMSAMLLAGKSFGAALGHQRQSGTAYPTADDLNRLIDRIAEDLRDATEINPISKDYVVLLVDRNDDGVDEVITYEYSDASIGLERTVDRGTPIGHAPNLQGIEVSFTRVRTSLLEAVGSESTLSAAHIRLVGDPSERTVAVRTVPLQKSPLATGVMP